MASNPGVLFRLKEGTYTLELDVFVYRSLVHQFIGPPNVADSPSGDFTLRLGGWGHPRPAADQGMEVTII